jgi:uncharacterized protein YcnI
VKLTVHRRAGLAGVVATVALAIPAYAWAHAVVSPPVAQGKTLQVFTLSVPTEKEDATTTKIELTVPDGFAIDSFEAAPGWKRSVQATGSGEEAKVTSVTWAGGKVPTEEDAVFHFNASTDANKTYNLPVRQTYSDGSVVDWNGSSSDDPVPTVKAVSSLGGGGGSSTLAIIALAVGVVGIVLAVVALVAGRGARSLT